MTSLQSRFVLAFHAAVHSGFELKGKCVVPLMVIPILALGKN